MPRYKNVDKEKEIVEGMWAATGRAYYTPDTGTNWCHLPVELRLECIKRMDFVTRTRLKRTAKTENFLVKSTKCHLKTFDFDVNQSQQALNFSGKYSSERFHREFKNDCQKSLNYTVNMLEHCEIDIFKFWTSSLQSEENLEPFCAVLPRDAPFRFKIFATNCNNAQIIQFFLKNCEGVEEILLNTNTLNNSETLGELFSFPSVINAKEFRLAFLKTVEHRLFQLVQNWIENDANVGKKLLFALFDPEDHDAPRKLFASIFKNQIISNNKKQVRIRTNNDSKHVFLRCDKKYSKYSETYFTCTIIPSDLQKLPEDCEWAEQIHGELFGDDSDDWIGRSDSEEDNIRGAWNQILEDNRFFDFYESSDSESDF